jgi:hypothetical protein
VALAMVFTAMALCFMALPFARSFPKGDLPAWSSMFVALCFSATAFALIRRIPTWPVRILRTLPALIAIFAAFELLGGFVMAFGDRYMRGPR